MHEQEQGQEQGQGQGQEQWSAADISVHHRRQSIGRKHDERQRAASPRSRASGCGALSSGCDNFSVIVWGQQRANCAGDQGVGMEGGGERGRSAVGDMAVSNGGD
jgi:hypothetical protein